MSAGEAPAYEGNEGAETDLETVKISNTNRSTTCNKVRQMELFGNDTKHSVWKKRY